MLIRRVLLLLFLVLPVGLAAQDASQSRTHQVTAGETLWDLAFRYYGDPFEWGRIFQANRDQIQNPNLILPGQQIVIPGISGEPAQVVDVQVETTQGAQPAMPAMPAVEQAYGPRPGPADRTVFYSANDLAGEGPDETLDYDKLYWVTPDLFQTTGWIDPTRGDVPTALGRISRFEAGEDVRSRRVALLPYDRVHIAPTPGREMPQIGDTVLAFRADQRIRDVGHVTVPTGALLVVGQTDSTFVVELDREFGQVRLGEWVESYEASPVSQDARPEMLEESDMEAAVVAFQVPNQLNGRGTVLHLNKGSADGVSPGDVFELRIGGGEGWTGKVAGRIIVHRVRENTAAGRVMEVTNPVFFQGTVVKRVARMN